MRGKIIFILLLLQAGLLGCHNTVSEIGSSLFTNELFNINYVDSTTVRVSTVYVDSIATSRNSRLLVGFYDDNRLGTVSAKAVFQMGLTSSPVLDRHTTEFVGLKLYLKRDKYYYYDTTNTQTIAVHRVNKNISLYNGFRYNTSAVSYDATPIGRHTFFPRPHNKDSIEIALPDDLGNEILTMAQTHDIRLSSTAEFLKYFKGVVLLSDSTQTRGMIGFTIANAQMRLYYRDLNAANTSATSQIKHLTFPIGNNVYFNKNHADRTGTPLESLNKRNSSVSSNLTQHEAYIQCGSGLTARLEMPYLRDFLIADRNFIVTRAILEIVPLLSGTAQSPPPPLLSIFRVDGQNRVLTASPQTATLVKDYELGQNTHYVADITSFVNTQIQNDGTNNNALLLTVDNTQFTSSVNRVYFGDKKNQFALKVKLYYISLSNQ